jgi:hypothetical protein
LAVQDFEISSGASLVAHIGQADGLLQVRDSILLANPYLMEFLITDECIGYVAESTLNGLAVRDQSLFAATSPASGFR